MITNEYKVVIYDDNCFPLQATVDVFLFKDRTATLLANRAETGPVSGEVAFGVVIPFALDEPAPVSVIVNDDAGVYAGSAYHHLNGTVRARLDLILSRLPSEPGDFGVPGSRTSPPDTGAHRASTGQTVRPEGGPDLIALVRRQRNWSNSEKRAVETLVVAVMGFIVPNLDAPDRDALMHISANWTRCLERLGIPVGVLGTEVVAVMTPAVAT